jgi:hypothetical protein
MSQPPPEFPRYTDRPQDPPPTGRPQGTPPTGQPLGTPSAGPPQDVPGWVPPSGPQQVHNQPYPPGPQQVPYQPYPPGPGQPYQYPAPYGFGYPSADPPGTSGLSIAALVTGLVGLGPIPVGLGIGALLTIRRTRESGTGMAIAGIVLGALQILLFGALVVIGIAAGEDAPVAGPDMPSQTADPPQTSDQPVIGELGRGECFDETETDFEVIAQPCDTAHDGEVFATLVLTPRAYPGDRAVRDEAEASCDREFTDYVGVDVHASELETDFVYPSRDMWEDGERDVMCLAYGPDGEELDRTVKDSKR